MYVNKLFTWAVANRKVIMWLFYAYYITVLTLVAVGGFAIYSRAPLGPYFFRLGKTMGEVGILIYILTLLPGIFRRLGLKHKLVAILMIYRRQIGIAMYLTVLYHYVAVRGISILKAGKLPSNIALFELFGMSAYFILLLMTLTSNDLMVKKLGIWWSRLHSLTYVVAWLIFAHVALRDLSIWAILIGGTAIAVLASHLYPKFKNK